MAKKIIVNVDVTNGCIEIRQGRLGSPHCFSGEWYTNHSMNEVVEEFCKQSVAEYKKKMFRFVKKTT